MRLLNFTIIKLTLCLILGIIIGSHITTPISISLGFTCFTLGLTLAILVITRKQFIKNIWFGLSVFILMTSIGVLTANFHNQKNFSNHYSNIHKTSNDSLKTITFKVKEVLKSGSYFDRYIVEILNINNLKTTGKAILNIKQDSIILLPKVDEIYITKTALKEIPGSLNPHQFNYKAYLEKQYIYHQLYCSKNTLFNTNSKQISIYALANGIREYIQTKLKRYNFKADELAIINALFLGQREDISKAVYSNYVNSGAVHILAVSGLHVGIILLILSLLLKPLEQLKYGKLTKTILLVLLLWSFAIITGLSASVTRAVTMFSIITIALNLKRPTNIYNTLAISLFILLLFKPLFLFDVGFQLSYTAVFSIVFFGPYLYKLWQPKNWLLDKYWHTLTVTISAQFGVIPISLFYFHQFSGLFFISNLVLVPLIGIILGFGILIISLALFNMLPQFLANLFGYCIYAMNYFVDWMASFNSFIFKDIPFNQIDVLLWYALIFFGFLLFVKKSIIYSYYALGSIVLFQLAIIINQTKNSTNELVIFHKSKETLIGQKLGNNLIINTNNKDISAHNNSILRDYKLGNNIKNIKTKTLQNTYIAKDKTLLVVDSLGVYNIKSFKPDYVLLTQSPKINLNRLIDSIKPKHIIADGSNYKSYVKHWGTICKKRKHPFYATYKKGSFILGN